MITVKRIPILKRPQGYYFRWYYNGWHYWQFFPGSLTYKTEGEKYRTYGTRAITVSSGPLTETQVDAVRTILNTTEVYLYNDSGWAAVRVETGSAGIKNNQTTGCEVEIKVIIGSRMLSVTGFSPVADVPVVQPSVDQCEVIIGQQVWMCKNYDSNYPGSRVYNNDEANRVLYGGLYTFDMINNPGFCPSGWHVPSAAEWQLLIDTVGGTDTAGGVLKAIGTTYWDSPNTGAVDTYNFGARGSGYYIQSLLTGEKIFAELKQYAYLWTKDQGISADIYGQAAVIPYAGTYAYPADMPKPAFLAVRLIRDLPVPTEVVIGTQTWKTANYAVNIAGSRAYNDNEVNRVIYGGLYTWYMIAEIEAANPGWHVATKAEFMTLANYLVFANSGGHLKEAGTIHWMAPNTGADNSTGFTALPAGAYYGGAYHDINITLFLWTRAERTSTQGEVISLVNNSAGMFGADKDKTDYYSIRLIKDV